MASPFEVDRSDLAWAAQLGVRQAVLWISSSAEPSVVNDEDLRTILTKPWAAIYDETDRASRLLTDAEWVQEDLAVRVYREAPPEKLPRNRLPIYCLPDPRRGVLASKTWFHLVEACPAGCDVFVLTARDSLGESSLRDAVEVSEQLRRVFLLGASRGVAEQIASVAESLTYWDTSTTDAFGWASRYQRKAATGLYVLVRSSSGQLQSVDVTTAVDKSDSVEERFDIVPADAAVRRQQPTEGDLLGLLENPAEDWGPYSSGAPFPRAEEYRGVVAGALRQVRAAGSAGARMLEIPVEPGSGATTTLRQIALDAARQGFPVAVARPGARGFNINQLTQFLARAADLMADAGVSVPDTPWLLMFDVEHVEAEPEFTLHLPGALKKYLRPGLVVAMRDVRDIQVPAVREHGQRAPSVPVLRNTMSEQQALEVGRHFSAYLPPRYQRSEHEWKQFVHETARTSPEGSRSLFWVALRFWLGRFGPSDQPLREWLEQKLRQACAAGPAACACILEVCAVSKSRLETPLAALSAEGRAWLRATDSSQLSALGLHLVRREHGLSATLSHPILAEELLRIAVDCPPILEQLGITYSSSVLDLELLLVERVLTRPDAANSEEGILLVEELVTGTLRIDPRESPRTWEQRERIVRMLESVPDGAWDGSQVFNHHVAIARRHLAQSPQNAWGVEEKREQLSLAENHLLDIFDNLQHLPVSRQERPLNLHVTYALTADARATLEESAGEASEAARYRLIASREFHAAESVDADNSYVLENFARHKLRTAEAATGPERVRLIVEAIQLLQREREGDGRDAREGQVVRELTRAMDLLESGSGQDALMKWAASGSEAAVGALAWRALEGASPSGATEDRARAALAFLEMRSLGSSTRTTLELRYGLVSRLDPWRFEERLEMLSALDADRDFAMPLQCELDRAVLLFQLGDDIRRRDGRDAFARLRAMLGSRVGAVSIGRELRFLRDLRDPDRGPMRMVMVAQRQEESGRNRIARIVGWGDVTVRFRELQFGSEVRPGMERDCLVEFSNFGPQAVPVTTVEER